MGLVRPGGFLTACLCVFSLVAKTKYHRPSDLRSRCSFSHCPGGWNSKTKVSGQGVGWFLLRPLLGLQMAGVLLCSETLSPRCLHP